MRSLRFVLAFALMSLSTAAFAQSDMHKSDAVQNSDAQKSFDQLKTLAGTWRGSVKATPPDPEIDNAKLEITLRVTSRGNALVHEMQEAGTPLDATKHDHPVFTIIDADHHTEDWTYMMPGDKPMQAHMDLQRAK